MRAWRGCWCSLSRSRVGRLLRLLARAFGPVLRSAGCSGAVIASRRNRVGRKTIKIRDPVYVRPGRLRPKQ